MNNHLIRPPACHAIGERLRRLRHASGYTISYVHKNSGVSSNLLSMIERDITVPTIYRLASLLEVYDVSIDQLLYDSEEDFAELLEMFK